MTDRRPEFAAKVRRLLQRRLPNDEILAILRRDGCNKLQSVIALVDGDVADLKGCKQIVHESSVWADAWERDEFIIEDDDVFKSGID